MRFAMRHPYFAGVVVLLLFGMPQLWAQEGPIPTEPPAGSTEEADTSREEGDSDASLNSVLKAVRKRDAEALEALEEREAEFRKRRDEARQRLAEIENRRDQTEATGTQLENRFDSNEDELNRKTQLLEEKIGALKELFGVFQQTASDLIGKFSESPTSMHYANRDQWLEGFANRMKDAQEVTSVEDIRGLWGEMLREIAATEEIVRLDAPVVASDGNMSVRKVVRVGTFNIITDEPQSSYLKWDAAEQEIAELDRQPEPRYLQQVSEYLANQQGQHALPVDPTGGPLMSLLVLKPSLGERIEQGGAVGAMILTLGGFALLLAMVKLIDIFVIGLRVAAQSRNLGVPDGRNPLGRVLRVYQENRDIDSESLDLRLHDQVARESGRIHRLTVLLALIAMVAPLMGLLGTVVGMINTFQAITLYGTGDPQTMAGGISQALITTVLGLIVAVPTVLLHAIVNGRGRALVNVLRQHAATLTGDQLTERSRGRRASPQASTPSLHQPQGDAL